MHYETGMSQLTSTCTRARTSLLKCSNLDRKDKPHLTPTLNDCANESQCWIHKGRNLQRLHHDTRCKPLFNKIYSGTDQLDKSAEQAVLGGCCQYSHFVSEMHVQNVTVKIRVESSLRRLHWTHEAPIVNS